MFVVPLSYVVAYVVGSRNGHREGWSQAAIVLSPYLLSDTDIGVYSFPSTQTKMGAELFAGGRTYVVISAELREDLWYVVARCKCDKAVNGDSITTPLLL